MENLLILRSIDDLRYALRLQATMQRQAAIDLEDLVKNVVTEENKNDADYLGLTMIRKETELIARYAGLPTMTEHSKSAALRGAMQAGATFAVAALVGETILGQIRVMANVFPRAHRMLFMVMLAEFSKPVSDASDPVEAFMRSMRIDLQESVAATMTPQERERTIRRLLTPLAEAVVLVSEAYGLLSNPEGKGFELTEMGNRVMVHMFDSQRFIEAIREAHTQLRDKIPQGVQINT